MDETSNKPALTAEIVSAYVSNNPVPSSELPQLIQAVYQSLQGSESPQTVEPEYTPVVSVRASVKPDHIVCLVCGAKNKMLKRHLLSAHGLTVAEYKERYKLPADYPLVAPDYAATRSQLAKKIGLGRGGKKKKK